MVGFNSLEEVVLRLTCSQNAALTALMETAVLVGRENTGHGFYTWFSTDPDHPALAESKAMLDGPNLVIGVGPAELPMGFILWLENCRPTWLEGFQYDTEKGPLDLKAHDLSSLKVLREWD
jgi:hypothetical protein